MTFELSGGALCLDFANTWADRERPEKDYLKGYPELVAFARQTGIVTEDQAAELSRQAREDEAGAAAALETARTLREAIYRLFSAVAADTAPPRNALEALNAALPEALSGLQIVPSVSGFAWHRSDAADSLAAPLRLIVRSAAELLTAYDTLPRVRECDGADCTWLFLDQSRNRSRRWCSMESCGNRAKVRRHYRRTRAGR